MAKVTVKLQVHEAASMSSLSREVHGRWVKLQQLPRPGDHLKDSHTYVEVVGIVHDINTSDITLVVR